MFRSLLFVALLLAAGCSDGAKRVEERFPGGQLRFVAYVRNGKLDGPQFMYWPSGQAHLEMHYINGRQEGREVFEVVHLGWTV